MSAATITQLRARTWLGNWLASFHTRRLRRQVAGLEWYAVQLERAHRETRLMAEAARVKLARWER